VQRHRGRVDGREIEEHGPGVEVASTDAVVAWMVLNACSLSEMNSISGGASTSESG
jgi:hypothetical protein